MHFIWDERNIAHIAEHGVSPCVVEAVFRSRDAVFSPSSLGSGRIECEGSADGRLYRLVFASIGTEPAALYPITCFPIRRRSKR